MEPFNVAKAELRELMPNGQEGSHKVTVQFNPETLKVSFANQVVPPSNAAGAPDQRGTAATQFVGKGTTKLSVQLWFDASAPLPQGKETATDVRELTKDVIYFITPKPADDDPNKFVPPGIRLLWGTFQFDGIVDSLEESLEFFSHDGKPLRASVTMSLSQQRIEVLRNPNFNPQAAGAGAGGAPPGTRPLAQAQSGSTMQGMAAKRGRGGNWQDIAAANNIENPRRLAPGRLVDMNVPARPRGRR